MKKKRIHLFLNESSVKKVEELKKEFGLTSYAELFRATLNYYYHKMLPEYTRIKDNKEKKQRMTKEMIAEEKKTEQISLCEQLGGLATEDTNMCIYYNYCDYDRFKQERTLESLSEQNLKVQYSPNKETIEKYREQGKTNY